MSDKPPIGTLEMEALRHQLEQARELYGAMLAEMNELRTENERLQKLGGGLVRDNSELTRMLDGLRAEIERLRAALIRLVSSMRT